MAEAHQRRKRPEQVRRALLDSAARLLAEHGGAALTVQAVAAAAGVTKGGLFHHFASRQALVEAVVVDLIATVDRRIDALLEPDETAFGRFTRAYVRAVFDVPAAEAADGWTQLGLPVVMAPDLQARWQQWLAQRLARHADTDSALSLEIVRLAVDGAWLGFMTDGDPPSNHPALRDALLAMTRPPA